MDEATLIAAARLGDDDAFTALYQQHVGYVRSVGRAILHSSDLDDLCQDVFLLAFSRLPGFEGGSSFRSWITRIAINQCLVSLRKDLQPSNGACNLVAMDAEMTFDHHAFASNDAALRSVAARLDLQRFLRRLRPLQQKVLEMAYLEGVPDVEIAATLGMSVAAVKSKLYRGKLRLREMFEAENRDFLP